VVRRQYIQFRQVNQCYMAERVEVTPNRKTKHLAWLTGAKAPFDAQRVFGKVANPPPNKKAPAGDTARAQVCEGKQKETSPRGTIVRSRGKAAIAFAETFFNIKEQPFAWHADAEPTRRKRDDELVAGGEFTELYDRRFPGRLAARRAI
jgi:hypothetical protein